MPLEIIIARAGIAGLSAAIGLAAHGHKVNVYERRFDNDNEEESVGGVQLQPNAIKILRDWGALDVVDEIAHDSIWTDVRQHTGETLLLIDMKQRGGTRWGPRGAFKTALQKFALQCGARIHKGRQVIEVDESGTRAVAVFAGGSRIPADLIVGADGTSSCIRRSLFPSFQLTTLSQCVFQVNVPLDPMQESPETRALLRHSPAATIHMAPGRAIISGPSFRHGLYDLQLIDWEYPLSVDPQPDLITGRVRDMSYVRQRWSDHEPGISKVLQKAHSLWKWRLREVRGLPAWSSERGRVLLIGDACHGIVPHSGQGAAMGIEDGAVLGELFAHVSSGDDIKSFVNLFEKIRRPRCDLVRTFATIQGASLAVYGSEKRQQRNQKLATYYNREQASVEADERASFASPGFQKWLDQYDVRKEVMKAVGSELRLSPARL